LLIPQFVEDEDEEDTALAHVFNSRLQTSRVITIVVVLIAVLFEVA
jgi:hypothetical protein